MWVSLDPFWTNFCRQIPPKICVLLGLVGPSLDHLWEATPPQDLRFGGSRAASSKRAARERNKRAQQRCTQKAHTHRTMHTRANKNTQKTHRTCRQKHTEISMCVCARVHVCCTLFFLSRLKVENLRFTSVKRRFLGTWSDK